MSLVRTLFVVMLLGSVTSAQELEKKPAPTTKLEAFGAKTGTVVIRGYTDVGMITGMGGIVSVRAREFRDATSPSTVETGISIEVRETSRVEREDTSYIDSDEIESLIKGLDYVARVTKEVIKQERFEAEYQTKGGFRVTVFNRADGKLSLALTSGTIGRTRVFLNLEQLAVLRSLVLNAQSKL